MIEFCKHKIVPERVGMAPLRESVIMPSESIETPIELVDVSKDVFCFGFWKLLNPFSVPTCINAVLR